MDLLGRVQFDVAGPFHTSIRGNKYFLLIKEISTRREWVYTIPTKAKSYDAVNKWKDEQELLTSTRVKAAGCDGAPELIKAVKEWKGVMLELTTIASSHQNGPAERGIRSANEGCRALLTDSKMPLEFWDEAVEHDVQVRNKTDTGPTRNGKPVSPEEAYTGQTPSIDHIRRWGSVCY